MAALITSTNLPNNPASSRSPASSHSPPITISASQHYGSKLAELTGRAFAAEPLTVLFAAERLGLAQSQITPAHIADGHLSRAKLKLSLGSEIVEAGNWAAAACWDPPEAQGGSATITDEMRSRRPIFVGYIETVMAGKRKYIGVGKGGIRPYWHLSMLARDPDRRDRGVVRAVIEPYVARAKREGKCIWIEAASVRARDVYAYFGWMIVEEFWTGKGIVGRDGLPVREGEEAEGVPIWSMLLEP